MPKFKGGVHVDEKGYLRISAGPLRNIRVATLVAEAMLGRELLPTEDVHHIDENKLNAKWWNLEVINHSEHGFISAKQGRYFERRDKELERQWNEHFDAKAQSDSNSDAGMR